VGPWTCAENGRAPKTKCQTSEVGFRYWCRKFGCTESDLREVVREVGTSAAAVEEYLKKKKK
jgi:hypothetical protein